MLKVSVDLMKMKYYLSDLVEKSRDFVYNETSETVKNVPFKRYLSSLSI